MKNLIITVLLVIILVSFFLPIFVGCEDPENEYADLLKDDNFKKVSIVSFINCIQGNTVIRIEGRLSLKFGYLFDKIVVIYIQTGEDSVIEQRIRLNDLLTYTVETKGYAEPDNYDYDIQYFETVEVPNNA